MGYNTSYELSWGPMGSGQEEFTPNCAHKVPEKAKFCPECGKGVGAKGMSLIISDRIRELQKDGDLFYAITPEGESEEPAKWYEHEEEVKNLSKEFPKYLFTLHGEGEESGDIWVKYFLNGKVQFEKAKIVFDSFDPKKLK